MADPVNRKDFEVRWRNMEIDCMNVTEDVKRQLADNHRGSSIYNMSETQQEGLKSIGEKIKSEGMVVFETDKSGKFSIDDIENFSTKMQPHLQNSIAIDVSEVTRVENELNARAKYWGRVLNIGAKWKHEDHVQ